MKIVTYAPSLEPPYVEALVSSLRERDIDPIPASIDGQSSGGATGELAAALVAWEALLGDGDVRALLLAGDDERGLAGALTGAKLELPMLRLGAADAAAAAEAPASTACLIALLAPDSVDTEEAPAAATEIAAWLERLPTLPSP